MTAVDNETSTIQG